MLKKDFFAKLKEQGRINNPDFDKFIEGIKDTEDFPDAVVKEFEDKFLTRERAVADPAINTKIWGKALYPVDKEIEKITQFIENTDKQTAQELRWMVKDLGPENKVPDTFRQLEKISGYLPKMMDKFKTAPVDDEATKKKVAEYENTIQEFTTKFTNAEKEYKENLKKYQEDSEHKLHEYKLDNELQKIGNKFSLAEAFEPSRPAITKVIMSEIRQSNHLKLGEKDGQPVIHVLDDKGQPKFDGNSPVTIESLLEKPYQPFLKKSEGTNGNNRENPKTTTKVDPPKTTIRRGAPTTVSKS